MSQTALDFAPGIDVSALCDDDDERAVARLLNELRGASKAMKVPNIAATVGVPTRKVQSIVHHLINHHGIAVGTSMRKPFGNFLAVTTEERRMVIALHRSRALSELATAAALEGVDRAEYLRRVQVELLDGAA